jgi:hypothetical protein
MVKKTKITECVYCGEKKKTTKDHVISQNLFPEEYKKKNMIIVPCCVDCNRSFSLDEEYFRIFLCGAALEHSRHADALFFTKVRRCIQRRPQIISDMYKRMDLVDLYTKSGIYLGKRTRINFQQDWERYCNVLSKYVKGLFFHEFKRILPVDYKMIHYPGDLNMLQDSNYIGYINKWNIDNQEIFAYGYARVPDTNYSIWMTVFYDSIFFLSFTLTEQDSKRFTKLKA